MIKTPESDPNHPVVGKYFKGTYGYIYYCDSYDSSQGYWMTPVLYAHKIIATCLIPERRNISESAINRTYLMITREDYFGATDYTCQHPLNQIEIEFMKAIL